MGMREYPNSGYLLEIEKVFPLLSNDIVLKVQDALEEGDIELLQDLIGQNLPKSFPMFEGVWTPNDEDTVDEPIEQGRYYLVFDQSDLFELTPKKGMEFLMQQDIKPEFSQWSVWG